jgi:hypothetical protein
MVKCKMTRNKLHLITFSPWSFVRWDHPSFYATQAQESLGLIWIALQSISFHFSIKSVFLLHTVRSVHANGFDRQTARKYGKYHPQLYFY